jgi:hypothetical protein
MYLIEDALIAVAEQFLDQDLCLKAGEKLLIYVDSNATKGTVEAIQAAASRNGISCFVTQLPNRVKHSEKERVLEDLIQRERFDVLCEASEAYFYPSIAWEKARSKGAGIYAIGALNAEAFLRCFGSVNRSALLAFGKRLEEILKKARTIDITTQHGTKIVMQMKAGVTKRSWLRLTRQLTLSMVSAPTGDLRRGRYTFLPGQLSFLGVPASVQGIAVINGYIWPPPELGVLKTHVVLRIASGKVTEIAGSGREADRLQAWLKGRTTDLKHFCLGFNPGAQLKGTLGEAERVFGAVTVGMGEYPFHVDAIMTRPTITVDGDLIEKDGMFVEGNLAKLQELLIGSASPIIGNNELL